MIRRQFLAGIASWVASLPILERHGQTPATTFRPSIDPIGTDHRKFVACQSYIRTNEIGHNGIMRVVTSGRTEFLRSTPWPWDDRTAEELRREVFGDLVVIPGFKATDITFSVDVFGRVMDWRITHEPIGGYKS